MDTYDQVILSVTKTIYSNYLTVTINQDSENDFTRHLYAIPTALFSNCMMLTKYKWNKTRKHADIGADPYNARV